MAVAPKTPTGFVIDTSALIDLDRQYGPKVFATLWVKLDELVRNAKLIAPREVDRELQGPDGVRAWVTAHVHARRLIVAPHADVERGAREIVNRFKALVDPNKTTPTADPHVIALARHCGFAVVSHEKPTGAGGPTAKAKMPDVCSALTIQHLGLFDMFHVLGWSF